MLSVQGRSPMGPGMPSGAFARPTVAAGTTAFTAVGSMFFANENFKDSQLHFLVGMTMAPSLIGSALDVHESLLDTEAQKAMMEK